MAGSITMSVCWVGRGKMSSSLVIILIMRLFFLTHIILSPSSFIALINAHDYDDYPTYDECAPYTCGNSTIRYHFGPCGPFHSDCEEDNTIYVTLGDYAWRVLGDITNSTYSSHTLQIVHGARFLGMLRHGMPTVKQMAVLFVIIFAAFSIVVVSCIAVRRRNCCFLRTASLEEQSMLAFREPVDSIPPSVENFLHYYSSQMPTRYSYAQIIAYTNNFSDKVGKGGFGTVYKGKFPSGRLIAVKMLDESKQSEQQFIAEVATVGRTYHVNLVRLLGYCSQVSKRALIYQYMINGSLDKYIHGDHQHELDWKTMHSIAVGTARGIAYLHDECSNRILHCDIKPANVLLDANFLPKVADFGLAKISDREESHISVAKRGTLGYSAPEMWSTEHGPVTDRSDVYSYGMLVMEMVGGRKNIDYNQKSTPSKFFYADWAFKQVEKREFGNLRKESMSEEDQLIAKRLSLVGLWCLQFNASSRPPISKVIQMLEGGDDIPIPPAPPIPLPVETPQQRCASTHSSSSFALEVKTVNTPEQRCPSNPSSSIYALDMETINRPLQGCAFNQSSSSYALGEETINSTTTRSAKSSRLSSLRRTYSSV